LFEFLLPTVAADLRIIFAELFEMKGTVLRSGIPHNVMQRIGQPPVHIAIQVVLIYIHEFGIPVTPKNPRISMNCMVLHFVAASTRDGIPLATTKPTLPEQLQD
jgi:hypothetical protein